MFPQLGLNLADYSGYSDGEGGFNFSSASQEELAELSKALEAGDITGRETTNLTSASGSPLKVESLDKTLKLLTFKKSDIVLWKKIPQQKAYNTVEEFNQLDSYGDDRGGFVLEGELPQEEDSTYIRRAQLVKFLGVVKSVTHVMTLTNSMIADTIKQETENGSMWILRKLNRSLAFGNSTVIPQEFNGVYHQHERHDGVNYYLGSLANYVNGDTVIDMRGKILTESAVEDAAEQIVENFGFGTDLFAPPKVFSNYTKQAYGNKYITPGTNAQTSKLGQRVPGQITNFGEIDFNYDIFLANKGKVLAGVGATHPKAPSAPTVSAAAVASDSLSKFVAGTAGNYTYSVRAINRFGESALTTIGAPVAVVAGGAVDLTITAGGGGEPATGYAIYRTDITGDTVTMYKIYEISVSELAAGHNGAAATATRDRDFFMANTEQAFQIQNDEEVYCFKQLAPLMKMDLAITSPAYRFMVLLYGTPILFAPRKMIRFINIGKQTV